MTLKALARSVIAIECIIAKAGLVVNSYIKNF